MIRETLVQAITEHRQVEIAYPSRTHSSEIRVVSPTVLGQRLLNGGRASEVFLLGVQHNNAGQSLEGFKQFNESKILSARILGSECEPPTHELDDSKWHEVLAKY